MLYLGVILWQHALSGVILWQHALSGVILWQHALSVCDTVAACFIWV